MKQKRLLLLLLIAVLVLSIIPFEVEAKITIGSAGEVRLLPSTEDWTTGKEPAGKKFTVDVDIKDLLNSTGATFSLLWNGSLLDLTNVAFTDLWDWDTNVAMKKYGFIDNDEGKLGDCGNIQTDIKAMNKTDWETMVTLEFTYVGPTLDPVNIPSVSTDIIFVDNQSHSPPMPFYWGSWNTSAWKSDFYSFAYNYSSTFTYTWQGLAPEAPTAYFDVVTPPPIYENTIVEFDASGSTGGFDGDSDTDITIYSWDFENTGSWFNYTGVGNSTGYHNYTTKGDYLVTLVVWAPKVGWANASYVNNSMYQDTVSIKVLALTGIDVYTEDERWAGSFIITSVTGVGPNEPADAYYPQENVTLFAKVIYNDDVVQNKEVAFEIKGPIPTDPTKQIWITRTDDTNAIGIATVSFRIPWPCENSEDIIFGQWNIIATVMLGTYGSETVFNDTLTFVVGWTVEITSVTTVNFTGHPKDVFKKCTCVGVRVNVTNIAEESRTATITVVVYDDAGYPIGRFAIVVTVAPGDEEYDTEFYCHLHVPKHAFVGAHGMVYANAYTDWPQDGGVPWCPEASAGPIEIAKA